jgi:PAS domain S-box-containing protein
MSEKNLKKRQLADELEALRKRVDELSAEKEKYQRTAQHCEGIINSTGAGIYSLDLDGKTTFANPAAARMLGWEIDKLMGKPMHPLIHHTRADGTPYPSEACEICKAYQNGTEHRSNQDVFYRKDGSCFPVD